MHNTLPSALRVGRALVEHQVEVHIEEAGSVLRALEIPAHPVQAIGHTAQHRYLLSMAQYPGIFASAALRRVDNQRSALQSDTSQSSRNDSDSIAIENVRP